MHDPLWMNPNVVRLYNDVMSVPEGPSSRERKRMVRTYVSKMSKGAVRDVLGRGDEIEELAEEEYKLRRTILLRLGFAARETNLLARCRLNSPGIRKLIVDRVAITCHATNEEIMSINRGAGDVLRLLEQMYGPGGLYGSKANR